MTTTLPQGKLLLRNILGAFSDGAVLFPLLGLLTTRSGFSIGPLLLSSGLAYIAAAFIFRVPMSVQPLKSIAVAAITVGATFSEVRFSGLLLGLACLIFCIFDINRLSLRVPQAIVHQLQVGLGALLILQGLNATNTLSHDSGIVLAALALGLSSLMIVLPEFAGIPLLGLAATSGLLIAVGAAIFFPQVSSASNMTIVERSPLRMNVVFGLVLPQLILTSANSVIATRDVCARYFGNRAWRVTARRLLCSIGVGNLIMAIGGGLPFCHGSGGVTAHVRGGSTEAWSTALMGILLTALSIPIFLVSKGSSLSIHYPPVLVASLLIATGTFHLQLAKPTATARFGLVKLTAAVVITILTRNLLWVLGAALFFEALNLFIISRSAIHDPL